MPAESRGPRPGRRPPPRTPRPATRAKPDPRLTRSRRPRARPSRTLARVRFTASSPGAVGSEETAELDRHLEASQRRAVKPGTDPHLRFHWPVDSAERDTQLRGRDALPLCFLQKKCEGKEQDS